MKPYYADDLVTVLQGDCLVMLRELDDASIDAVVTDPPYGLEFMGKEWDGADGFRRSLNAADAGRESVFGRVSRTSPEYRALHSYQEWCEAWARECLRVLKPGGYLLAFGGTRTYHRLVCGIEDAGFDVRDFIDWIYGSGFPKSLDVSKALDKRAGYWRGKAGDEQSGNGSMSGANYERTDKGDPVTPAAAAAAAAAAAGWGTALKPAHEPCVVARKPFVGTVADNWLEHGTGALNIAACRVGDDPRVNEPMGSPEKSYGGYGATATATATAGRWPSNIVLDESAAAELDRQTGVLTSGLFKGTRNADTTGRTAYGEFKGDPDSEVETYGDSGGASRFFPVFKYEAKAPSSERPTVDGVLHPTVKPLDLMRWLIRLVTPAGGVVLDPFLGSGTTAEACVVEGFRCIGIEREPDYLPLIRARLSKPIETVLDFGEAS